MNANPNDSFDWAVRSFVYAHIVASTRPPTLAETSARLGVDEERARAAYHRLDGRHALFLAPGTDTIRMAHPFSGVPTPFRVRAKERTYSANCAWDAFGIPAALHAAATIEASYAEDDSPATIAVGDDGPLDQAGVIHFPKPFRFWYDDLIDT